jgi:hypothetical protein
MTIDGVNILTTYNLKLSTVNGHISMPSRKKLFNYPTYREADIRFEEKTFEVVLFGFYSSSTQLKSMVQGLQNILDAKVVHDVVIPRHLISKKCVFKNGLSITAEANYTVATVKMLITETNE